MSHPTPNAGSFAWLTAGAMLFTLYGSFVPFNFHYRSFDDAIQAFQWVLEHRHGIDSRSDFAANTLLGGPLGFCLLAALRVDKPANLAKSLLTAVVSLPWCVAFSTFVEFCQLYFPGRTSSGSDIIAQTIGSALGMAVWLVAGVRFVRQFRGLWQGDRIGGTAGRLLFLYVCVLGLVMWLPFDLTLSPGELYHKNVHSRQKIVLVPFAEITNPGPSPNDKEEGAATKSDEHGIDLKLPIWIELAGLYLPAGLLAGCINRSPWNDSRRIGFVALAGLLLGCVMEGGQLFVMSRTTSITDVIIGTLGVLAGWGIALALKGRRYSLERSLILGQAWIFVMLVKNWYPFDFNANLIGHRLDEVNWIPFAAAYEKNYLSSLEVAAAKTLLFAPLGAIIANPRIAIFIGIAVAMLIEAGQLALRTEHYAGPTDLLYGVVGAWLGAAVARRLRNDPANLVRFRVI